MDKNFPPKMIKYLDSIIEHGTFTKAAQALYISQPYLTQSIQKIEENLGITIVDRNHKPLRLTKAGQLYHQHLHNLMNQVKRMERELLLYSQPSEETITIGILPSLGNYLLPLLLPDFMKEYIFYNFQLKEQLPMESENDLIKGEIDFYIGQTPEKVNATFEKVVSGEHPYYMIIPESSRFYKKDEQIITKPIFEIEDLLKEQFVLTKPGSAIRKQVDELFSKYRQTPMSVIESENIYSVAEFARKGIGLTIVPKSVLHSIENFKGYNLYQLPVDLITLKYFISYLPDKQLSPMEKNFIQFFIKRMDGIRITKEKS